MESKDSIYTDITKVDRGVRQVAYVALILSIIAGIFIYIADSTSTNININNAVGAANIIPSMAGILIAAIALIAYVKVEDPRSKQTDEIVRARNRVIAQFDMILASWMRVKSKGRIINNQDVDFTPIYNSVRVTQKVLDEALYGTTLMSMLIRVEKSSKEDVPYNGLMSAPEIMASFSNACEELLSYEERDNDNDKGGPIYPKRSLELWKLLTNMNEAVRLLKVLGDDSDVYRHITTMGAQDLAFEDELSLMVDSAVYQKAEHYEKLESNIPALNRDQLEETLRKKIIDTIVVGTKAEGGDEDYGFMNRADSKCLDVSRKFYYPDKEYDCLKLYADVEVNVVAVIKEIMKSLAKSWNVEFIDLRYKCPPKKKETKWLAFYVLDHSQQSEELMLNRIRQMNDSVGGLLVLDGFPFPYAAYLPSIVYNLNEIVNNRAINPYNRSDSGSIKFPKIEVIATRYIDKFIDESGLSDNEEKLDSNCCVQYFYQPTEAVTIEESIRC